MLHKKNLRPDSSGINIHAITGVNTATPLTNSFSFVSCSRDEYFRRTHCRLLAANLAGGENPADYRLVGSMVKNVCLANTRTSFGLGWGPEFPAKRGSPCGPTV